MKIAIVGLGLIGGSLAKTIKKRTSHQVMGIDRDPAVLEQALKSGAIDCAGSPQELFWAELTFLCLYPKETVAFLKENKALFAAGSIVTDTAGVKTYIYEGLNGMELPFTFLGGHPMAGKEVGGFANASDDLFDGASYIFTPQDAPSGAVETMRQLAGELGFRQSVLTTPKKHDSIIAYTSQIAHVLACAYVLSPRSREHFGFSAGSFRDVSRVAKINEELWTQLFLDNRTMLVRELDTLIDNLMLMRGAIEDNDKESLQIMLRRGREIKEELDQ